MSRPFCLKNPQFLSTVSNVVVFLTFLARDLHHSSFSCSVMKSSKLEAVLSIGGKKARTLGSLIIC